MQYPVLMEILQGGVPILSSNINSESRVRVSSSGNCIINRRICKCETTDALVKASCF